MNTATYLVTVDEPKQRPPWYMRYCPECDRAFDLRQEEDCDEFAYGHDCEG